MRRTLVRSAAVVAVAAGLLSGAPQAQAADSVTVSTSDVQQSGSVVTGLLTLRSRTVVEVAPASLRATIDGESRTIKSQPGKAQTRTAMLVIDTSGSMAADGMSSVRAATASYLKTVPPDVKVGVVSFATTSGVDLSPTTDRKAVQRVVNGLDSRGDTALYGGLQAAVKALGKTGDRSIVLLSDGADTVANDQVRALRQTTTAIRSADIRVDVVRFKSNDPDAATALRGFAAVNGGTVVSAENTKAVVEAFKDSAEALDSQVPYEINVPERLTGIHELEISGVAGGIPFVVKRTIDFGTGRAAPAIPPVAATTPPPLGSGPVPAGTLPGLSLTGQTWFLWLAAVLVGLSLFLGLSAMLAPSLTTRREKRVAAIENYVAQARLRSRSEHKPRSTPLSEQLIAFGEKQMKDRKSTKTTMALIDRADLPLRAGEWFVLTCVSIVVCAVLGVITISAQPLFGLAIGAILGIVLPQAVLRFLARRRADKFERTLPDVLMLVATSLSSGFGLPQALDAVAKDAAEPAAKEFSRALAETRIGTDISDALDKMATRMDSTSMRWAVMAIRIQREVGGNLADTLRTTAQTLRDREALRRQVQTLSAEGRLSAVILVMLPIAIFLYMLQVNYEYISLLWTTTTGLLMSGFGIGMLIIGIIWMRNIVQIEA